MQTVDSSEAKTHLSTLLDRVAKGEQITITRLGVPVAMLVPLAAPSTSFREEAIQQLMKFGVGRSLGGLTVSEVIDEGRRR